MHSIDSDSIVNRWDKAKKYFQKRRAVIFLSYCRFWEPHPFVQQSLAKWLVDSGVDVHWFDGAGMSFYKPTLYFESPKLNVRELFRFRGERFAPVHKLNIALQKRILLNTIERYENPVIWIQAGFDEDVVAELPYVDIYSTFDDPYRHRADGVVAKRAKVIVCQNSFAEDVLSLVREKSVTLPPPFEMASTKAEGQVLFPNTFPKKRMGYIGSLFSDGFDFMLLEKMMKAMPDWGFLLQGRTDEKGMNFINSLRRYSNFHYLNWTPPEKLAATWKSLSVCLLLYRETEIQAGAFPVKIFESFQHGIPAVATKVRKTADLAPYVPRSNDPEELVAFALNAAKASPAETSKARDHFAVTMDPRHHLATVAELLLPALPDAAK